MTAHASQPVNPRENSAPAPTHVEGQPSQGAPTGAPEAPSSGFSPMLILIMALPLLLVILTSRSQSKKQKKIEESLKVGDRVFTRSGLIGKLTEIGDRTTKVEIAPGVTVQMLKTAIEGTDSPVAARSADSAKDKESLKDKPQEKKA